MKCHLSEFETVLEHDETEEARSKDCTKKEGEVSEGGRRLRSRVMKSTMDACGDEVGEGSRVCKEEVSDGSKVCKDEVTMESQVGCM